MDGDEMPEMFRRTLWTDEGEMTRRNDLRSMDGYVEEETANASPTAGNAASHRPSRQSTIVSAIFLALLPLPASAYPQSRNKGSRRDRKRSGDFTAIGRRGEGGGLADSARNLRVEAEWDSKPPYQTLGVGNEEERSGVMDRDMHYRGVAEERIIQTSEVSRNFYKLRIAA